MIQVRAPGVGQQVLLASQVDETVLYRQRIRQRFKKKTYRIGWLQSDTGQSLISGDNSRFNFSSALRRK